MPSNMIISIVSLEYSVIYNTDPGAKIWFQHLGGEPSRKVNFVEGVLY